MENPEEEKLLVAWVNSLGMPHCLLVDSYRDMLDGSALSEIVASKFDETKRKRTLSSSIEYLGRKFGWSSLPPFLSRRDAADMIALGEYRGVRDLLRFLRRMYEGKDYEDEDEEDSEEDKQQHHSTSNRVSKDRTEQQQRKIVRSSLHHRRHRQKSSTSSSNRQGRRRKPSSSSSSYYRREQSSQLNHHQKQHLEKQKPQWNASTSMMRSRKTFRKSSSKKSSTSSGGVFRMNDMIDPTYVPRKPSPPIEKKKKRKKKKKKRFQILSPVRNVLAWSSTYIAHSYHKKIT